MSGAESTILVWWPLAFLSLAGRCWWKSWNYSHFNVRIIFMITMHSYVRINMKARCSGAEPCPSSKLHQTLVRKNSTKANHKVYIYWITDDHQSAETAMYNIENTRERVRCQATWHGFRRFIEKIEKRKFAKEWIDIWKMNAWCYCAGWQQPSTVNSDSQKPSYSICWILLMFLTREDGHGCGYFAYPRKRCKSVAKRCIVSDVLSLFALVSQGTLATAVQPRRVP